MFGGHKQTQLRDGTVVELDSGTCVTEKFSTSKRVVQLTEIAGEKIPALEAIFRVAADSRRPFSVEAGPLSVQVLGTQFDVLRRADSTRVAVIEGKVQIASLDTRFLRKIAPVTERQQVDVPDDTAQQTVLKSITSDRFAQMTAWKRGYIVLDGQTLTEMLQEFSRYQHFQAFVDPSIPQQLLYSAVFHTTAPEEFLRVLSHQCIHGEYDRVAQRITLSTMAGKQPGAICSP